MKPISMLTGTPSQPVSIYTNNDLLEDKQNAIKKTASLILEVVWSIVIPLQFPVAVLNGKQAVIM